ncbi:J protein JJJ2 [Lingula anatina]|uniref:J protein JJJ2 n=1 Tax=Lingula anatina TaxID=7574 RepID=A0A1S3ILC0_LINAN|nr:J protein JJJ2 [Lingula anatina]XP_013398879.1 J protein JJJ2 [Lingula anatina]XP_013398880.1 J protein JJJ2 [Lingula anatina]XP_013398882.1 J protein JJJ2 [Lingula anatina]XP_013398883.1 J protein JJJ2 [Lingula anatina]XP_013398884.1 J protein JJJ2 [Lingula anatina]|eukprot:XP_013398878.1 J protein JJJ2 [Lingula anatina]
MKDHYAVLGLTRGAGDKDIKRAFHTLARELHPDKNSSHNANDKFREVKEAYEALKDEDSRESYHLDCDFEEIKKKCSMAKSSTSYSSKTGYGGRSRYHFYSTSSPFSNFRDGFDFKFNDSSDTADDTPGAYKKYNNSYKESKPKSKPKSKPFTERKPNRSFRTSFNVGGVPMFSFSAFCNMGNFDTEFEAFFDDPIFSSPYFSRYGQRTPGFRSSSRASPDDFAKQKPHKPSRQRHKKHKYNMYGYDSDLDDDLFDWTPKTKPGGPYVDQTEDYYSSEDDEEQDSRDIRKFQCPNCTKMFTLTNLIKHEKTCGPWSARYNTESDWRQQREEMLNKVRSDKKASRAAKKESHPSHEETPTYKFNDPKRIQCQFCYRYFSSTAANKHIPFCMDHTSTTYKPPPSHRASSENPEEDTENPQDEENAESHQSRESSPDDSVRGKRSSRSKESPGPENTYSRHRAGSRS